MPRAVLENVGRPLVGKVLAEETQDPLGLPLSLRRAGQGAVAYHRRRPAGKPAAGAAGQLQCPYRHRQLAVARGISLAADAG